jgi:acyl-CoA synthetase (AMP-forming)/AMP-acid ligase II/acyl carrier protein
VSKTFKPLRRETAAKKAAGRPFLCLHDLLACYGRTAPNTSAILVPRQAPVTYGALWARANHTVRGLRSLGIRRGDRVAVVLPNGPEAAVTLVAVAAGAVCVPLNPGFTAEEWRRYFGVLRVSALLTRAGIDSASREVADTLGIPIVDLSPQPSEGVFALQGPTAGTIADGELASSTDDAFVLLTSGTSSRPKTVPLTHAAVCRSAYNVGAVLALAPHDRLLNVLPLFHVHGLVSGLVAALAAGSSVVCTAGFDPAAFFGWLKDFRPTWYTAVPAIHRAVLSAANDAKFAAKSCSLRFIRSASSTLGSDVTGELEALFGVPVIDTYGMTEAASQIAANPIGRRRPGSVGQPAGAQIAIMDRAGRRLPAGKRGEIALRGPTITRGYDNDAIATEAAFRDSWFHTGDVGYFDQDGYLFIVGRIKDIINRGGQKVAPAEVEQALLAHPEVVDAAAFSVKHKRLGEDVAAAVVLRQGAKASALSLRDFARERLARYKVPSLISFVPEIPKGPAGKINRDELVASITPPTAERKRGKLTPPRSKFESQLAMIWAELLELNEVGVDEDVFALGADSIAVTQMLSRLRALFRIDLSFKDLLDTPTVGLLAARLEALESVPRSLSQPSAYMPSRMQRGGPPQVSIVQERILRIERELPGLPQFNLPFAYRLQGRLNIPALQRSFVEIVRRHESLRTAFTWRDELPVAIITPAADIKSSLIVEDLAARASAENSRAKTLLVRMAELEAERECLKPIDVKFPPLFRARLFRLGVTDHVLLLILHDIIIDGWSMGVFMDELSKLYDAFTTDGQPQLPEPALQFSDFALWQRQWSISDAASRQFAYWKERLSKASPVFGDVNSNVAGELTARIAQERFHISKGLVARLSAFSHSRGATLFMTLLAAFKTLLMVRSGRNDICVASMMANRFQPGVERVIGPFANTTLIRTRIDADLSFQEALDRVREAVIEAHARQELPFDVIVARLAEEGGVDAASLIRCHFALQGPFRRPFKLHDVTVRPFGYWEGQSMVMPITRAWLRMTIKKGSSGITGTCWHKNDLFEPDAVQQWIEHYKAILVKAASNPTNSLHRVADG